MHARTLRTPSCRLHKPSGQAVATLNGRDIYLGAHGSDDSKRTYDRVVSEWLTNGREPVDAEPITVVELLVRYLAHVDARSSSGEPASIRHALKPVRELYDMLPAADFGPLALKAIRSRVIDSGNCRSMVNRRVRSIVRMFKWGVSEQLVSASTWETFAPSKASAGGRRAPGNPRRSSRSPTPSSKRPSPTCPARSGRWSKSSA
ncbi:hypothetical protein [Paludisphaera mucosa]|uniref:Core-binding (CB) domain-containing protein n=1 Tax=Paludisphaera mucosa TaxID=3030827 RepID=A0ABT6F8T6_9BACT|nr:hypothetical protein [Paludisphaera mucosa]MDG3003997.1 hypothetical protein [Paludisphaera mucosa]